MNEIRDIFELMKINMPDTAEHCRRTAGIVRLMSGALKVCDSELYPAALLHDIGKIVIPNSILNKKGKLSEQERDIIDYHAYAGYKILNMYGINSEVCSIVRFHHGHEGMLIESDIGYKADILRIADAYDAITSNRPYRVAMSHDEAVKILTEPIFNQHIVQVIIKSKGDWIGGDFSYSGETNVG